MAEIKNIVFDMGKVLVDFDWDGYLASFHFPEETLAAIKKATFPSPQWTERDRGVLSDEEYLQIFYDMAPEYKEELKRVFEHETESLRAFDYSKQWIEDLQRRGYRVYLLSNISRKLCQGFYEKLGSISEVDGTVYSCEVHSLKPEPEIYQILFETYGLKPEECIFIDDLPGNIQAAKEAGMKGIVFEGYEAAVKQLEEYLKA